MTDLMKRPHISYWLVWLQIANGLVVIFSMALLNWPAAAVAFANYLAAWALLLWLARGP